MRAEHVHKTRFWILVFGPKYSLQYDDGVAYAVAQTLGC